MKAKKASTGWDEALRDGRFRKSLRAPQAKEKPKDLMDHRHYGGDGSIGFWNRVNAITGEEHAVIYALGCVLQDLEARVLLQLNNAEGIQAMSAQRNKCTYPTGCTRKRLPGLMMCRRHQPYPATK